MTELTDILTRARVMPVLAIQHLADAVPIAQALMHGGATAIEVTLRTAIALEAIRAIRKAVPDLCVGSGTVLTPADLQASADAGATFAVSPGLTPTLLKAGSTSSTLLLPGIASASELMLGLEAGYTVFKLFPAEAAGGIPMLKSLAGPFAAARFCPTGGITSVNAPAYLTLSNVLCIGGSWLVDDAVVAAKSWGIVTERMRAALAI